MEGEPDIQHAATARRPRTRSRAALLTRLGARLLLAIALTAPHADAQNASQRPGGTPSGSTQVLNDPQIVGTFVSLVLDNGDRLSGTILEVEGGFVVIEHPVLDNVRIPTTRVVRVVREGIGPEALGPREPGAPAPAQPTLPGETPIPDEQPPKEEPEPTPPVAEPIPPPQPPKPAAKWQTRLEFGLDGSDGNSERLNFRGGFRIDRETEATALRINSRYVVNTSRGNRVANRFTLNARNDWRLPGESWSLFVQGGLELNEFRDFDTRVTGGAGFANRFIETEKSFFSARAGAGFAREYGSSNHDYSPELITGLEFRHRFTQRQTFFVTAELFPDLKDVGEFRSIVRPTWEIKIDDKTNLSLRFGFEHRYETNTPRQERWDIDYFATVVLTF